jgi:hypothetical protein
MHLFPVAANGTLAFLPAGSAPPTAYIADNGTLVPRATASAPLSVISADQAPW